MEPALNVGTIEKPDIFKFLDFRSFLRTIYDFRKKDNPVFSYTVFARKANMNKSLLRAIIENRRSLSEDRASDLAKACELNEWESAYFVALVMWSQSTDSQV